MRKTYFGCRPMEIPIPSASSMPSSASLTRHGPTVSYEHYIDVRSSSRFYSTLVTRSIAQSNICP